MSLFEMISKVFVCPIYTKKNWWLWETIKTKHSNSIEKEIDRNQGMQKMMTFFKTILASGILLSFFTFSTKPEEDAMREEK